MHPGIHARTRPDHPAVIVPGHTPVTYRELDEGSIRLARTLAAAGLTVGDRVALLAENHPRYLEIVWAALRSGLYVVPINRNSTADEAAYLLADSGAAALIVSARYTDVAEQLVESGRAPALRWSFGGSVPGYDGYDDAVAARSADPLADQPRGQMMMYSSGTTGRPKGVWRPLSGRQIDDPDLGRPSDLARATIGMDAASRYLIPAPLYHSAGLVWAVAALELGATVVVLPRWDAEDFLAAIADHRITHTQVVPTMMARLAALPDTVRARFDVSSLQCMLHSAAPCPPAVKRAMIDWFGPVVDELYASTEGNGVTFATCAEWLDRPGTVGRAVAGRIHICDEDGNDLPPGEIGTLYFQRDTPTFAYHGDEDKTAGAAHPAHPDRSTVGDLGWVDDDGFLYLSDRRTDLIISGGVNVYPAEIEASLAEHPGVADAAVIGLPDEDLGRRVHAVVEPAAGYEPGPDLATALTAHVRARLAGPKVPRGIDFLDRLPRLESGKVQKHLLRDRIAAQQA